MAIEVSFLNKALATFFTFVLSENRLENESYDMSHTFACCVLGYSVKQVDFYKQILLGNGRNKIEIQHA